jgi:hypothetical protein
MSQIKVDNMESIKWLKKQDHFDWMQKGLVCWQMCEKIILKCIENEKYVNAINACRDTAEMCSQCIKFKAQGSPFFKELCEICADVCEGCAQHLARYEKDDSIFAEAIYGCKLFAVACLDVAIKEGKNLVNPDYPEKPEIAV